MRSFAKASAVARLETSNSCIVTTPKHLRFIGYGVFESDWPDWVHKSERNGWSVKALKEKIAIANLDDSETLAISKQIWGHVTGLQGHVSKEPLTFFLAIFLHRGSFK